MTRSPISSRGHSGDAGMSLIEVLVALLVFAILSTGVVAGMVAATRMTDDNRARVVAAGLAAQDIALARAVGDPLDLADQPTITSTAVVGSRTYTITRSVSVVSQTGVDVACNTSTDLFYARVNTTVRWSGMVATAPVRDDTLVASQGRINDGATGTVSVSVIGADGLPRPGVSARIVPTGTSGAPLAAQPAVTDVNGCTRAGNVTPGEYSVTLSKTGYLDILQNPSPSRTVLVTAGANQAVSIQYDLAANYNTAYTPWPLPFTAITALTPTNLDTTFINATSAPFKLTAPATAAVPLHPFPSGYSAIAGAPADSGGATVCAANDPLAWPATSSNGPRRASGVRANGATGPGQTTDFKITPTKTGIPMGVVLVRGLSAGQLLVATVATAPSGSGSPGCVTPSVTTYAYTSLVVGGQTALMLPYGSYTVSILNSSTSRTQVTASNLSVPTNLAGGGVDSSGVVTLDPRPAG